jgi:hypothetical protein
VTLSLQSWIRAPKPVWRVALEAETEALRNPEPAFNLEVGSVKSYNDMFSGTVTANWTEQDLIREALHCGRLLLSGRGGGAKTVLLGRLAKRSVKMGYLPIFLSLKAWTQAHSEVWNRFDSSLVRMDFLFRSLLKPGVGTAELDSLPPSVPRLILVDGLNEVDSRTAQGLIFSLDEYASTAINTSIVVSDRLVRREFISSDNWSLALALPLTDKEISRQLSRSQARARRKTLTDDERELLRSPYFLDAYLNTGQLADTRAEEIRKWFKVHVGLSDEELRRASEAAYVVYGTASRTFNLQDFERVGGADVTRRLTESGSLITPDAGLAVFDHHLKHDFLASNHLAAQERLWNSDSFDHVTFSGSSFDAIMMCVEQINENAADRFIREVYDWNLYGVGYSLGESRRHNVSAEMRTVILAMFAERKWDSVSPTRQRAEDTLRLLQNRDASEFLEAATPERVFKLVSDYAPSPNANWFFQWRQLFTRPLGSAISDEVVNQVRDGNSVLGWTTANVLKRTRLTEQQQAMLRTTLDDPTAVFRWRAAHALGSFPSEPNAAALLTRLDDEDKKVRYGAVRSLLELASGATDELREYVFAHLIAHREQIVAFSSVREEIRRCVLIPGARNPKAWLRYCLKLMSTVQPNATESERDRWSRAAQELIDMFAAAENLPNA